MKSNPLFAARLPLALALGGSLILSACTEPEVILAGKREPVRSVLQNPDPEDLVVDVAPENTTRAVSFLRQRPMPRGPIRLAHRPIAP